MLAVSFAPLRATSAAVLFPRGWPSASMRVWPTACVALTAFLLRAVVPARCAVRSSGSGFACWRTFGATRAAARSPNAPSDFPRLSEAEAAALDGEDIVLYRDAYFHGSRTPKACGEARRADGSVIGSARR